MSATDTPRVSQLCTKTRQHALYDSSSFTPPPATKVLFLRFPLYLGDAQPPYRGRFIEFQTDSSIPARLPVLPPPPPPPPPSSPEQRGGCVLACYLCLSMSPCRVEEVIDNTARPALPAQGVIQSFSLLFSVTPFLTVSCCRSTSSRGSADCFCGLGSSR